MCWRQSNVIFNEATQPLSSTLCFPRPWAAQPVVGPLAQDPRLACWRNCLRCRPKSHEWRTIFSSFPPSPVVVVLCPVVCRFGSHQNYLENTIRVSVDSEPERSQSSSSVTASVKWYSIFHNTYLWWLPNRHTKEEAPNWHDTDKDGGRVLLF